MEEARAIRDAYECDSKGGDDLAMMSRAEDMGDEAIAALLGERHAAGEM